MDRGLNFDIVQKEIRSPSGNDSTRVSKNSINEDEKPERSDSVIFQKTCIKNS